MSNDNDGFSVILLLVYLWPIWLLLITYFTGRHIERKHYADIEAREAALRHIMVIAVKKTAAGFQRRGIGLCGSCGFQRLFPPYAGSVPQFFRWQYPQLRNLARPCTARSRTAPKRTGCSERGKCRVELQIGNGLFRQYPPAAARRCSRYG